MLARLLLVLLLAVFAMPSAAPATCHDATPVAHTMPMPASAPDHTAVPIHACIGCIPPADWLGPRVRSPELVPIAEPFAILPARLSSIALPPTIPPPKDG